MEKFIFCDRKSIIFMAATWLATMFFIHTGLLMTSSSLAAEATMDKSHVYCLRQKRACATPSNVSSAYEVRHLTPQHRTSEIKI